MAKRGSTRPWRVRFEWDNGVKGTLTCGTREEADREVEKLRRTAELRDADLTVTVKHRDEPAEVSA